MWLIYTDFTMRNFNSKKKLLKYLAGKTKIFFLKIDRKFTIRVGDIWTFSLRYAKMKWL